MFTFLISVVLLILGYIFYGKFVERHFGADPKRETPVKKLRDGVDYQEMKPWRMFVIQFLNIAGLGPIFGAILGAAYGPMAYLWIVIGCIFMGSVHDYCSGMLSLRNDGTSLPNLTGKYLGNVAKWFMIAFSCILLIVVGSSFVKGPADLMHTLTTWNTTTWIYIIFAYYIIATLLPIDKIIGTIYPFFGAILIFMAVSVGAMMLHNDAQGIVQMVEFTPAAFHNYHANPSANVLFPMLFIVISCGAISGFHATQSPMMARCMANEKYGRPVFYGAMILEGVVALIWASAAMAFYGSPEGLNIAAGQGITPAILVNMICKTWLGKIGGVIAILGVVVCPITSGDTAFRSMRLTIGDAFKINQKPILNRILIAVPIFVIAYLICLLDFSTIWNYVGIMNQLLAMITLWTIAAFFKQSGKSHWLSSIPAMFITVVCISYLFIAPHKVGGLALNPTIGYCVGGVASIAFLILLLTDKRTISR